MNRLRDQHSPHLRQHADDPVDWWPWCDEAFAHARERDVPILLSIGYSSCHWCHVMGRESFADPAVAAVMNEWFVNIKVDREVHPDVDALYMEALRALTGHGGWPMTVFCDPGGRPFSGGTYHPPEPCGQTPSFSQVLERVHETWLLARTDVEHRADALVAAIERSAPDHRGPATPGTRLVAAAAGALGQRYDAAWGGFGGAPKFPQFLDHEVLLLAHRHTGSDDLLHMVTNSIDAMASGGIYDHLGGGIARYSTDERWLVPHFEKMLYDNAQFARLCLHAWQVTGLDRYLQVVDETIGYVLRDLRHPDGAFYAAEDAESEGIEGKFTTWTPDHIHLVLGDDAAEFGSWFGVDAAVGGDDRVILHRPVRGDLLRPVSVELSRQRLLAAREMRIRPALDDLVLTEWNGLMLSALAEAALATANHQWLAAAQRAGTFLLERLRRPDGRWLRYWQEGDESRDPRDRTLGVANDLTAVVDAFTRLTEATGDGRWLGEARTAVDQLIELFWDDDGGGLFTTGADAPRLIVRAKDVRDQSTPSANSAAAVAMLRLSALTGDHDLRRRAEVILELVTPLAEQQPAAHPNIVIAADLAANGFDEVVVPGDVPDLLDRARVRFLPHAVLAWGSPYDSPLWDQRIRGHAYVCRNGACAAPATDPAHFDALLDALEFPDDRLRPGVDAP